MPYSAAAKDVMIDAIARGTAPGSYSQYLGLFSADAGKAVTAVGSTGVFTATAHGYSNGDVVLLSAITGGSGFVAGRIYYVVGVTANTFQLAAKSGGAAITGGTDMSAGTSTRIIELTGGSPAYARSTTAFAASANGQNDDNASHTLNVPAGSNVDYVSYHSAASAGTLYAVSQVTRETFAGQGTYSVTDSKFDLLAAA